jgi:hypothetical protein
MVTNQEDLISQSGHGIGEHKIDWPGMSLNFRSPELSSNTISRLLAMLAPLFIGVAIHGMSANQLGLYWDDGEQFMQGLQAADGNVIQFILSDTFGYLHAERPVAHFLMMIHRAAFAISLPLLHWSLVILLLLNAITLEIIASKLVRESWFVFAVGVVFLAYPLSPLQAVWPSTSPHLWACLLALLTILFSWYGMNSNDTPQFRWFILAAITYIASILTHEVFALLPLAFVSLFVRSKGRQKTTERYYFARLKLYKPAIWYLILFVSILGVYGLWRFLVLPLYGSYVYPKSQIGLNPAILVNKFLYDSIKILIVLWPSMLLRIAVSPLPLPLICWSAILFIFTWVVTFQLLLRSPASDRTGDGKIAKILGRDHWVQAAIIGLALAAAAVIAIGISPVSVNVAFGATFPRTNSRVNFIAIVGIALALPAILVLLVRSYLRYRGLSSSSIAQGIAPIMPRGCAYVVSGAVACIVLSGTLFQFSIKEELVTEWRRHIAMLEQLRTHAPSVEDDTFIMIVDHRPGRSIHRLYSTHGELSSYCLAIYDNWTIMCNTDRQLRFYADGIQSMYYTDAGTWFPPGVRGPMLTHAKSPIPHIPYDRLLLFEYDGLTLHILPQIDAKTALGYVLTVHNNPNRILDGITPRTAVWRHLTVD